MPDQSAGILRLAFRLKFLLALASYAGLLGLAFLIDPHARLTIAIVALAGAGLLCQPFDVFDLHFQSENKFRLSFCGRAIPILLSTAVKIAALFARAPLLAFAALETAEAILVGAALWFLHRLWKRETSFAPQSANEINWSRLLGEGLPLLLASLAVMIYMRADILMLGKMAGFEAAGIYSAAAQVTEACALFPLAFAPALFPILGALAKTWAALLQTTIWTPLSWRNPGRIRCLAIPNPGRSTHRHSSLRSTIFARREGPRHPWLGDNFRISWYRSKRIRHH